MNFLAGCTIGLEPTAVPIAGEDQLSLVASVVANSSGYQFVGTLANNGIVRIITPSGQLASIKDLETGLPVRVLPPPPTPPFPRAPTYL